MGNWVLKSEDGEAEIDFSAVGNGSVSGTLTFQSVVYDVVGQWAAADSVPGRNYSAFAVWASYRESAPEFVAAAGTMAGPGSAPESVAMNLIRTDSTDGLPYGWSGTLKP